MNLSLANMQYKKIIIKIGTNVITKEDGLLNRPVLEHLVKQIVDLKQKGVQIIVVSSGAMGAGRGLTNLSKKLDDVARRQVLAAVGQPELMRHYVELFKSHGLVCAQVLATKEDFGSRQHYLNMRHCFESLLNENIIAIVNENDVVSVQELMFTDNDELASLVASMMKADALILLSSVEGILDAAGQVIHEVTSVKKIEKHLLPQKSSFGRGGMITKCRMAEKLIKLGTVTHIARGDRKNVLIEILEGQPVGTRFVVRRAKISPIKQWIAYSEGKERGVVGVNVCAEKILRDPMVAASLLPVGIVSVNGEFKKGDMVKIANEKGVTIGYGLAQYDAKKAGELMGKKGGKELIHYDYLFIYD